jgi:ubiquinone/menaquinone biosynthesis C-methylase UbiE
MDSKELNALVHDREAAFYDDRFLIDYRRIGRDVRADLRRALGALPHARAALDVACGTGYLAIGIAQAGIADETHATDLSARMVERTRANAAAAGAPVHTSLADAERLPYADATFDLVVARGALHHVPEPLAALKEMKRVLAPGGTVLVLHEPTPNGERQTAAVVGVAVRAVQAARTLARRAQDQERLTWELASMAANLHTFEPEEISNLAMKAGFDDIEVKTVSWSWVLALGVNYYLAGEFERAMRPLRPLARAITSAAARFDNAVADRVVPSRWRHTIQAVLR